MKAVYRVMWWPDCKQLAIVGKNDVGIYCYADEDNYEILGNHFVGNEYYKLEINIMRRLRR